MLRTHSTSDSSYSQSDSSYSQSDFSHSQTDSSHSQTDSNHSQSYSNHSLSESYIMDPTYDFSFTELFGSNGTFFKNCSSANRLISLLNSLFEPILNLRVEKLEFHDTVFKGCSIKSTIFDISARCTCRNIKDKETIFGLDVEMQRTKMSYNLERFLLYNARSLNREAGLSKKYDEIKSIGICFLDYVFIENDYNFSNDIVFKVAWCKKDYDSADPSLVPDGTALTDNSLLIVVNLYSYAKAFLDNKSFKCRDNEWLYLLSSRRLAEGLSANFTDSGCYTFNPEVNFDSKLDREFLSGVGFRV